MLDYRRVHIREGAVLIRYPVLVDDPVRYQTQAKKRGVLLGNWYHHVIDPAGTNLRGVGYTVGSCPVAELVAKRILNFPTLTSHAQATYIVASVK